MPHKRRVQIVAVRPFVKAKKQQFNNEKGRPKKKKATKWQLSNDVWGFGWDLLFVLFLFEGGGVFLCVFSIYVCFFSWLARINHTFAGNVLVWSVFSSAFFFFIYIIYICTTHLCCFLFQELIMCSLVTFYFGVLSAFSPSFLWLLILRGLVGFGIGGAPQA